MSDYWVSHKKYFCKYCNIYIADDAPSRNQHESGLRHKGNVERFVRGIYKAGEKRKNDLEEEKREMARVEQAANAAFARDVGAGLVKPGSSSTPGPSKPAASKPAPKPSSPWANYSTAESLGFTDPDAERMKAEAERRQTQGVAGEWELVSVEEPTTAPAEDGPPGEPEVAAGVKREAEVPADEEDGRQFKLRKKKVGVGLGELYDPGLIPIKLKTKKEESTEAPVPEIPQLGDHVAVPQTTTPSGPAATTVPKWSAKTWSKPTDSKPSDTNDPASVEDVDFKPETIVAASTEGLEVSKGPTISESDPPSVKEEVAQESIPTKTEEDAPSGGSLFRKRKLPTGKAGSRGRGR